MAHTIVFQGETGGLLEFSFDLAATIISGYLVAIAPDQNAYLIDGIIEFEGDDSLYILKNSFSTLPVGHYIVLPQLIDDEGLIYFLDEAEIDVHYVPGATSYSVTVPSIFSRLDDLEDAVANITVGGGITDHGLLTGLADDDHTQYLNNSRGDARYYQLTTDLATQTELNTHESDTTNVHGITNTSALVLTSDSRLADSRAPSGNAGGVLGGTYPNPTFAVDMATQAELDTEATTRASADTTNATAISDEATARAGADTTNATNLSTHAALTTSAHGGIVASNDSRLTDARTPTAHVHVESDVTSLVTDLAAKLAKASNLSDLTDASAARTNLGLVINTNVQAYDSDLTTIAGLVDPNADRILFWDDSAGAYDYLTAGTNLSITGTTLNATGGGGGGAWGSITGTLSDQTDLQSALNLKAPLASPTFTGTPAAPTAAGGTNTTQIATTAFVTTAVANIVDAAPGTLDTLNELAAALGDDPDFATTITTLIGTKLTQTQADALYSPLGHNHDSRYYTEAEIDAMLSGVYQPLDSDLTTIAGLTATTDNFIVSVSSAWASRTPAQVRTTLGLVVGTDVQAYDAELAAIAGLTSAADKGIQFTGVGTAATYDLTAAGKALLDDANNVAQRTTLGLGTAAIVDTGTSAANVPTTAQADLRYQALDSDLTTIAGLTATTDNFIVSASSAWASRTPTQVRTTLGLVIGTNVQAWDADLDTIAGLTATTDNFMVSVASAWASRTPTQVRTTLGLVIGTNVQAWDADLDTIAGLTATTDNFIASVGSAWASRTPSQVRTTLGLVIGTNVQAWDADLDTIAGLTATTDNFIVSVSSAWASRTPTQVRTTLGLVIGTNVQAWDADLDTWATKTAPSGTVVGTTDTQTLTNKRISPRTGTTASSTTPTINTDNVDFYSITAQAADITSFTTNLSGTPTEGQKLWIAVTGTATRAITWGASFEAGAVALPTTTSSTTRLDVGFVWNTVTSKWRCMSSG